ncbi:MAG: hypothetical protein ACR2MY_01530 [Candidatus Dormibacteria bacterium]
MRKAEMEVLLQITEYLNLSSHGGMVVPMQERSLEIFGREKRLGDLYGQRLFLARRGAT